MANDAMRRLRKERKLSLETLAEMVGLSTSQVSRFETGKRDPRVHEMEKIAVALGCQLDEIMPAGSDGPSEFSQSPPMRKGLLPIPLVGRTAAGVFREVVEFEEAEPEYVFEPEDEDFPQARRFALTVEGDSMNAAQPPIPDGARVICVDFEQTGQSYLEGMIVVVQRVREGGHLREWSVKEIELHDDEVWFCPRSTNSKHRPIKVLNDPEDDQWNSMEVIGLVRDVSMRVRRVPARKA